MYKLDFNTAVIIFCLVYVINGLPKDVKEKNPIVVTATSPKQIVQQTNKTISELVKEQTENIKKIVAAHKPASTDYPTVTKYNADVKVSETKKHQEVEEQNNKLKIKQEKERQSIEELRLRCHNFFKFPSYDDQRGKSGEVEKEPEPTTTPIPTVQAFGPQLKPDFLRSKSKLPTTLKVEETTQGMTGNYFIFTDKISTTEAPKSTQVPQIYDSLNYMQYHQNSAPNSPYDHNKPVALPQVMQPYPESVKYVKYEPVVFQKTLVTNGQNFYYWYRAVPKNIYSPSSEFLNQDNLEHQSSNIEITNVKPPTPTAQEITTSTTTQKSTTTTTRKPTTTTRKPTPSTTPVLPTYEIVYKTTPKPAPLKSFFHTEITSTKNIVPNKQTDESNKDHTTKYKSELKFILPMSFTAIADVGASNYPWQMDPYAYYPKSYQPNVMNIQVPYMPTFHMIRALGVPNKDDELYHRDTSETR